MTPCLCSSTLAAAGIGKCAAVDWHAAERRHHRQHCAGSRRVFVERRFASPMPHQTCPWRPGYLLGWRERFASLGKIFPCSEPQSDVANMVLVCGDTAASTDGRCQAKAVARKVRELKSKYADRRPVILVGMSLGAKVIAPAIHARLMLGRWR